MTRSVKQRADRLLVEKGLAESREKAQALILAGKVLIAEQRVEKPGQLADAGAAIRVIGEAPYASRAGAKLQAALDRFGITVRGRTCADLGASTGGFTDCLLKNGAARVHAFDVGRGLLAWKLATDSRVVVHDGFNVRHLRAGDLPPDISLVTVDLSFISVRLVLPALRDSLRSARLAAGRSDNPPIDVLVLVKPQFEVGKGEVGKGGIVRDLQKRIQALESVETGARCLGYLVREAMESPVAGARGNREFLLHLQLGTDLSSIHADPAA